MTFRFIIASFRFRQKFIILRMTSIEKMINSINLCSICWRSMHRFLFFSQINFSSLKEFMLRFLMRICCSLLYIVSKSRHSCDSENSFEIFHSCHFENDSTFSVFCWCCLKKSLNWALQNSQIRYDAQFNSWWDRLFLFVRSYFDLFCRLL